MPVHIDTELDVKSKAFQDFLVDDTLTETDAVFVIPEDFEHDEKVDQRGSNLAMGKMPGLKYSAREIWTLQEQPSGPGKAPVPIGTLDAHVILEQDLLVDVTYAIAYAKALDAKGRDKARELFHDYDQTKHGADILAYIADNSEGLFLEKDIHVQAQATAKKNGAPTEVEISQREALLKMYGVKPRDPKDPNEPRVIIEPEQNLDDWAKRKNLTLVHTGTESMDNATIPADKNTVEAPAGTSADDPLFAEKQIDKILQKVVPPVCGNLQKKQFKLLRLYFYPEFKVTWHTYYLKIGCTTIGIPYPKFEIRHNYMVVYVYYRVIHNLGQVVMDILEACAMRGALGAGVLGIITGNPAIAAATFKMLFKACVENEVKECVFPGLLRVIEKGQWQAV